MRTGWRVVLLLQALFCYVKPTHVTGVWDGDKYKFLQKFAIINGDEHYIYLYGNFSEDATLVFVPSDLWKQLEHKITGSYEGSSCQDIMKPLCDGDYVRPCVDNYNECGNEALVPGSEVTYSHNDSTQFYYAFLSSCVLNGTDCNWKKSSASSIDYDLWFVSGDPCGKHDALTYQFSYHEHGILIVLMIIIFLYVILLPLHLVGYTCLFGKCQMPNFVRIFTTALTVELLGLIFILIHYSVYTGNGKGVQVLYDVGFFLEVFADCVLLLIVLLIAKGYRITISVIRRKRILIAVWVSYFAAVIAYAIWGLVSVQIISVLVIRLPHSPFIPPK